ncbi:hypothetical protein [Streptomyces sp. SBT349]|uniref:hypothetical protein n=1 Tax=Streptomyces sp. SBT349 TaxID=1580539 RepID=UPI00069F0F39|nr:hypothetical protein [Streptomyces sp. SBT349]
MALAPEERNTRLAERPYDLRHAGLSARLAGGADPQTVAKRAGHSVVVLLRVSTKFINDSDDATNAKIAARLAERSNSPT